MKRREFTTLLGATALGWTLPSRAQSKTHRVGFLTLDPADDPSPILGRLEDFGYVEGVNLIFTQRSAEGDPKRLSAAADALIRERPDVIVTGWGTLAPKAAKEATSTIPIVFSTVGDPVGAGLVQNLARPGANLSGFSGQSAEYKGKQLQLLKEVVPDLKILGVLLNPDTPYSALALK